MSKISGFGRFRVAETIEGGIYRSNYGLRANLVVLWVFTSRANEARFLGMVGGFGGSFAKAVLTQSLPSAERDLTHSGPAPDLFLVDWNRASGEAVSIARWR
jgi:hypothetical protein